MEKNYLSKFKEINTFIFDVDGVLTDGSLLVMENGNLLRTMNIRDGYAIQLTIKKGFKIAVITGGKSEGVISRLKSLGVTDIYSNCQNKKEAMEEFVSIYKIDLDKTIYMGDDLPDYENMNLVGLPCCPQNAAPEIIKISKYISPFNGGQGCVRDVIEKVLKLQNKWIEE